MTIATMETISEARTRGRWRPSVAVVLAMLWLAVIVLCALFARFIAPYGALDTDLVHSAEGPSGRHLLGTDQLGRDILSRLMFGAAPTISSVALAILVYTVFGLVLGLIAGYAGGWADRGIMAYTSVLISLPGIIVLFVVLSVYRGNTYLAMLVFGFISSPVLILIVRASALAVRDELFVDAARVSGLPPLRIVFSHVLPRSRGVIIVQAAVFGAVALIVESSLSFLGFGTQPPSPSWGNMMAQAAQMIAVSPSALYPIGAVIALTALSLGIIGDSLVDSKARRWTESKLTRAVSRRKTKMAAEVADRPLLAVRNLSIAYRTDQGLSTVVREVSFDIARGEAVGLAGESGSGKTTIALGILGVIGYDAVITEGSVAFAGADLVGRSERELSQYRGKRIAYVAQEPMVALSPNHRVGRQLYDAVRINDGITGAQARGRVQELLAMAELRDPAGVERKYPHELSGGMAQRVSIAFALSGRPELLVADEPTTALDVTVQAGILGLLRRLREQTGMSLLLITHDWGVIADTCERVIVMYRGEIVESGSTQQVYSQPEHPYTAALLASNPHGAQPGTDLPVISGEFETPSMARRAASPSPLEAATPPSERGGS